MATATKAQTDDCPLQKTAHLLSDTWTMLIIRELLGGPKRFCELEQALEGISTRTLALKLRKLEQDKLIHKSKDCVYSLTKKGEGLEMVARAMRRYGEEYL